MALVWSADRPARWDASKQAVIGATPPADVGFAAWPADGALLPGEWWVVRDGDAPVAYAWMDVTWGYAPVRVAVAPAARRHGVGRFAMDALVGEARRHGLSYVFNDVPAGHSDPTALVAWLGRCGFAPNESDGRLFRRRAV